MAVPRRIVGPTVEPVLLSGGLAHLRENAGVADEYIEGLITVARVACEDRLQRTLINSTWRLQLDAFPAVIELGMPPVSSVASVKYIDEAGAEQTLASSEYVFDASKEPAPLKPASGKSWPRTADVPGAVKVEFVAGYGAAGTDVPAPIRKWIEAAVAHMYENRLSDLPTDFGLGYISTYRFWG